MLQFQPQTTRKSMLILLIKFLIPDRNEGPKLHNLVKLYQLHRYPRTCTKYKNEPCKFKLGKFFSKKQKK